MSQGQACCTITGQLARSYLIPVAMTTMTWVTIPIVGRPFVGNLLLALYEDVNR